MEIVVLPSQNMGNYFLFNLRGSHQGNLSMKIHSLTGHIRMEEHQFGIAFMFWEARCQYL